MRFSKRFALSTLLLVMLLTSLIFGYAQWRRQWITAEVKQLASEIDSSYRGYGGVPLTLYDNRFWPTVSNRVVLMIRKGDFGQFIVNGRKMHLAEARDYFNSTSDRLYAVGVDVVHYGVVTIKQQGSGRQVSVTIERSADDLTRED